MTAAAAPLGLKAARPRATAVCLPLGVAFDQGGKLYTGESDRIYSFFSDPTTPPVAGVFASGVPGANGLAFDEDGNLWTSDGTTGQGRVWKINAQGIVTEMFRIQPIANEVNLVAGVGGVGRDVRTLPLGTITVTPLSRNAANTLGSQPLVANGLAFDKHGDLFVSDTARGALWKVKLDRRGNVQSRMGCDTTFTANTLCLDDVFVAHPLLEGADGIALDREGNIWVNANERNAVVAVTEKGSVIEVFRNAPDAATRLRKADTASRVGGFHYDQIDAPVASLKTFGAQAQRTQCNVLRVRRVRNFGIGGRLIIQVAEDENLQAEILTIVRRIDRKSNRDEVVVG